MNKEFVEVKSFGEVFPKTTPNNRVPYEHQKNAMHNMDIINKTDNYSTLIVLPTGGGKTYTASGWLLKNAINKKKKILWIAHRQMLLDQAAESFQKFAYQEAVPNISSFKYRIISGSTEHDRMINIKATDDILIVSKDSVGRNLSGLDSWLKGENEIYFIVDEAHHSTAKTYRKVIEYIKSKVPNVKLIGLTATPFRTAEQEQGLLSKIYTDGVHNDKVVKHDIGITYQISLKELINRQILSSPIFESYYTEELYGNNLGLDYMESIQHLDVLPDEIAGQMADSAVRNKLIVETYKAKKNEYGQTIVFAVNVLHAIHLSALFNKEGIKSEFIVSDVKDAVTGVTISRADNERKIEKYRNGELDVLINVNILTEGVDLPQTKTVFLARPTVSTVLMTQMVGRALRGEAAGGTKQAYIVSFIDDWNGKIAWINPQSIFGVNSEFSDNETDVQKRKLNMISIAKIEEFAAILDNTIDTTELEKIPFEKRIPLGMYAFTYLENNGIDLSYQVMVYDSTKNAYENMMNSLHELFEYYNITDEYLEDDLLYEMADRCRNTFFLGNMTPPLDVRDLVHILKYYAQYESAPSFYTFDDIDKSKLDVAKIAQTIWDEDMGPRKKAEYIDTLWENADDNLLKLFFGRKLYLWKQIDIELAKISTPDIYDEPNIKYGQRNIEELSLYEIGQIDPEYEKKLRDDAFTKSVDKDGKYICACCGKKFNNRIFLQVDHIKPMNKGGLTTPENLQILCRECNGTKGDK